MYYLVDLLTKERSKFKTKEGLVFAWHTIYMHNVNQYFFMQKSFSLADGLFDELNVTGRDCYIVRTFSDLPERRLRRYQVLDEQGHSIDIRQWMPIFQKIAEAHTPWEYREGYLAPKAAEPIRSGFVRHNHRYRLPTLQIQARRDALYVIDFDELDQVPLYNRTKVRNKTYDEECSWDKVERKVRNRFGKKNWKDQSKAIKQWAKHRAGCDLQSMRYITEAEEYDELEDIDFAV